MDESVAQCNEGKKETKEVVYESSPDTQREDRATEARRYLEHHKIPELLNNLAALLVYNRPDKPREFLIEKIEEIRRCRDDGGTPCHNFFTRGNLDSVFDLIDITGRGVISKKQNDNALVAIGAKEKDSEQPPSEDEEEEEEEQQEARAVGKEEFVNKAVDDLNKSWATFASKH